MENAAVPRRSPPRLVKWPFFAGDALLIALAVTVLVVADGPLNVWQIAFCVLAVVIGALLLVAPFVLEFYLVQRLQQEFETQSVETVLRRINVAVGEIMEMRQGQKEELRKLEHTLSAYEGLGGILEQRLKGMQREDRLLRELGESLERVEEHAGSNTEALRNVESTLVARIEALADSLAERAAELSKVSPALRSEGSPLAGSGETELIPGSSRLWDKAKGRDLPSKESPVHRVIRQSESPPEEAESEVEAESPPPEGSTQKGKEHETEAAAVAIPAESGAGAPDFQGQPVRVRANILIGIGNKIHVRGHGAGLSMERGIPMEFVEIGLFEWVSEPVENEVEIRLYLNDEVEAEGSPLHVHPGETIEIAPDFRN